VNRSQILLRILLLALLVLLLSVGGYLIFRVRPQLFLNSQPSSIQPAIPVARFQPDKLDSAGPVQMFVDTDNNSALWQVKGRLITPLSPSGQLLRSQFVVEGGTSLSPPEPTQVGFAVCGDLFAAFVIQIS
jgi:hypothetical protein